LRLEAKSAEPKAAKKPGGLQWMPHEIHLSELSFLRKIYAPLQFNATKKLRRPKTLGRHFKALPSPPFLLTTGGNTAALNFDGRRSKR
jgi:hypothetical protein